MNHPKTGEQELERLAEKYNEGFKRGVDAAVIAHQSETELLRKRVEKLRSALWQADKLYAADKERAVLIRLALEADDKETENL